jgi:hypothetical protein
MSEEEKALIQQQTELLERAEEREELLEPWVLQSMRLRRTATGEIEQIPYEEWLETLSPDERASIELKELATERSMQALQGELEIDPSVEEDIDRRRVLWDEQLRRQGLRPGDTGYDTAMSKLEHQFEVMRVGLRHGELQTAEAVAGGRAADIANLQSRRTGQMYQYSASPLATIPGYAQPMGAYQHYRGTQTQAAIARSQQSGAAWGGLGSFFGQIGGAAIAKWSSRELKENISPTEGALAKLMRTPIYNFKYKKGVEDSGRHIGMISEEAPEELQVMDGKAVDLYSSIGLTMAALKELAKEVRNA